MCNFSVQIQACGDHIAISVESVVIDLSGKLFWFLNCILLYCMCAVPSQPEYKLFLQYNEAEKLEYISIFVMVNQVSLL